MEKNMFRFFFFLKTLLFIRLVAAANTTMYFIISTSKFIRTPSLGGLQGSRPRQGLETWLYITRCQVWESGWIKQFIFLKKQIKSQRLQKCHMNQFSRFR